MNTKTMLSAINGIDEALIDRYFEIGEEEKKKKSDKRKTSPIKWISIAACLCLMLATAVFTIHQMQKAGDPVPPSTGPQDPPLEVIVGAASKPSTGHYVGMKCLSFYRERVISVDAFMIQSPPSSTINELNGYPVFEVFQSSPFMEIVEDGKVKINGGDSTYEKRFTADDMHYLFASSSEFDVFDGHSEKVTLDFSELQVGETATVAFTYGFFFYENNYFNSSEPDNSWVGNRQRLSFYVGENGISVSANGIESAIENYEKFDEGSKNAEINFSPTGGCTESTLSSAAGCSAKAIYLKSLSESVCSAP